MIIFKVIITLSICQLFSMLAVDSVHAWGPGVHMAISLGIIHDVTALLPSIGNILSTNPIEYLYGCLSADFFIGKTHKATDAHLHTWKGGFQILAEATDRQETAFAYGFLSHLAADVIAHHFFIPSLVQSHKGTNKMEHLYWEMKADYVIGHVYTEAAQAVLSQDHNGCDELLKHSVGKRKNRLRAKKRMYTHSVKISNAFNATRELFFSGKDNHKQPFHEYVTFLTGVTYICVKNFLKCPGSSYCLLHDPMGKPNYSLSKSRDFFSKGSSILKFRRMDHWIHKGGKYHSP